MSVAGGIRVPVLVGLLGFLATTGPVGAAAGRGAMDPSVWFAGGVEEAFAESARTGRPVLVYWGAVWCPPCNEIKGQVFSRPGFAELAKTVIPVLLDGDTPEAQHWGDVLRFSGYPTILVFDPARQEIMRIAGGVSFDEFSAALQGALTARRPFRETLERARAGRGTGEDWGVLAWCSWSKTAVGLDAAGRIEARLDLLEHIPAGAVAERALLAAGVLEETASADPGELTGELTGRVRAGAGGLLDSMLAAPEAVRVVRSTLVSEAADILEWLHPGPSEARDRDVARWLEAVETIRNTKDLSLDTRLWAAYPRVEVQRWLHPDETLPTELVSRIVEAVETADREATSGYDRHAILSGAALLLRRVGEHDRARKLLLAEIETTDTPWYYQSSLSSLEKELGNMEAALEWSGKARASARGPATRLQWIVSDLKLNARHAGRNGSGARAGAGAGALAAILAEYYRLAMSLPDGFSGRNGLRAKQVVAELASWRGRPEIEAVIGRWAARCAGTGEGVDPGCKSHFESLGAGAVAPPTTATATGAANP